MANPITKFGVPLPTARQAMKQPKSRNKMRILLFGFGATGQGDELSFETNTAQIPVIEYETHVVDAYNSRMNYKGKYTVKPFDINVRDTISNGAIRALQNQLRKEFNHFSQEARLAASHYKFECWIQMLDGSDTTDRAPGDLFTGTLTTYVAQSCMITNYSSDELDMKTADFVSITMTIQADNVVVLDENGKPMGDQVHQSGQGAGMGTVVTNTDIQSDAFKSDKFSYLNKGL